MKTTPTPKPVEPVEIAITDAATLEAVQLEYACSTERIGALVKQIVRTHVQKRTPALRIRIARAMLLAKNNAYELIPSQLANQVKVEQHVKAFYPHLRSYHERGNPPIYMVVDCGISGSSLEKIDDARAPQNSFISRVVTDLEKDENKGSALYPHIEVPRTYLGNPSSLAHNLMRYKEKKVQVTRTKTKLKVALL